MNIPTEISTRSNPLAPRSLVEDPLIRAVMTSDKVSASELEGLMDRLRRTRGVRPAPGPAPARPSPRGLARLPEGVFPLAGSALAFSVLLLAMLV